ncbi:unnamed protein product [Microthlaspi erraticum]|uniref:Uncharacterized protein n=1 Tax=Microthlaspi erraticum TaxID=1685480 RepID=A0A6D2HN54_9BRAS|nr:unnamed protein product [Microthlaspi erraticum]
MEKKEKKSAISSMEGVLVGALTPGVNAPTWKTLKFAFLLLGLCLVFTLPVTFTDGQSMLPVHSTNIIFLDDGDSHDGRLGGASVLRLGGDETATGHRGEVSRPKTEEASVSGEEDEKLKYL